MSLLLNTPLPKQQNPPAILTAYLHLLNGKYNMELIFIIVLVIFKLELRLLDTYFSISMIN